MEAERYLNWDSALMELVKLLAENQEGLKKVYSDEEVIILRDWRGRIHIGLPGSRNLFLTSGLLPLIEQANALLGPLSAASIAEGTVVNEGNLASTIIENFLFFKQDLFDPEDFWKSPNLVSLLRISKFNLSLLDRQDKENDWLKSTATQLDSNIPRAVFFGVKGGVGRSSALTALALHLSNQGRRVLVIDADFESPGISSSLLNPKVRPDLGLVDWLTADALGYPNLEDLAQKRLVETSPLSERSHGKILIAPSHGIHTEAYVCKLGRMYRTTEDGVGFAERLNQIVTMLERLHSADITLIDSRAGIDDTAAATITQLNARVSFMFAINTQQTWDAYSLLFKHLKLHPSIQTDSDFRYGLRFVAALTPEEVGSTKGYWAAFRESAYATCAETLYDKDTAESQDNIELDAPNTASSKEFNPAFDDEDTPHFPMKIMWDEVLRAFDPVIEPGQLAPAVVAKSFGDFLERATRLLE